MISFKGAHFPKDIILSSVFFYVRYGVSYRDLEEIMEEWGVSVNAPLRLPGEWMKPISKSRVNGFICIEPLINSVTPSIHPNEEFTTEPYLCPLTYGV